MSKPFKPFKSEFGMLISNSRKDKVQAVVNDKTIDQ